MVNVLGVGSRLQVLSVSVHLTRPLTEHSNLTHIDNQTLFVQIVSSLLNDRHQGVKAFSWRMGTVSNNAVRVVGEQHTRCVAWVHGMWRRT
jgi:hypothetical protein